MRRLGAAGSIAALAVAFHAAPASACGPGGTGTASHAAPAAGAIVPLNIPGVAAINGTYSASPCTVSSFELLDSQSQPIDTLESSTEPGVHLLTQPLTEGETYRLRYEHLCDTFPNAVPQVFEQDFSAGPSLPLPTSTGTLKIVEMGSGPLSISEYSCTWSGTASWVSVQLTPACDLVPFLPVVRFTMEVGGQLWVESQVGATTSVGESGRLIQFVYAGCSGYPTPKGTSQGSHMLSLRAHIVGSAVELAPATIPVTLSCPAGTDQPGHSDPLDLAAACEDADAGAGGSGGIPSLDAGCAPESGACTDASVPPPDATDDDAGVPPSNSAEPGARDRDRGCAIGPPTSGRQSSGMLLLTLAFGALRRRSSVVRLTGFG